MRIIICPQCKQRLEVPEELLGTTAACPTCGAQVVLTQESTSALPASQPAKAKLPPKPPQRSAKEEPYTAPSPGQDSRPGEPPSSPAQAGKKQQEEGNGAPPLNFAWKKRYRWGFTFVRLCQILAALAVLLGATITFFQISDYIQRKNKRWKEYREKVPSVAEAERTLEAKYRETVKLLQFSARSTGFVPGFKLKPELLDPKVVFNYKLLSLEDVEQSKTALGQYDTYIEGLGNCICEELLKCISSLQALAASKSSGSGSTSNTQSRSRVLHLGREVNFYQDEGKRKQAFEAFQRLLRQADGRFGTDVKNGFDSLSRYLTFMQENLISDKRTVRVGENERANRAREEVNDEKKAYYYIALKIIEIASTKDWQLKSASQYVRAKLADLEKMHDLNNELEREDMRKLRSELIRIWVWTLAAALFILVISDALKGFFDIACNSFNTREK